MQHQALFVDAIHRCWSRTPQESHYIGNMLGVQSKRSRTKRQHLLVWKGRSHPDPTLNSGTPLTLMVASDLLCPIRYAQLLKTATSSRRARYAQ